MTDALELDEIDNFFSSLDASLLGSSSSSPAPPAPPPAPSSSSSPCRQMGAEEQSAATDDVCNRRDRNQLSRARVGGSNNNLFDPANDVEEEEREGARHDDSLGYDEDNQIIYRLMHELKAKDLRIASLASENETLRSELHAQRSLPTSPTLSSPDIITAGPRSGFSSHKSRINQRINSLGFGQSSKSFEAQLAELLDDGKSDISSSSSAADPLIALNLANSSGVITNPGMSEMALIGHTNLMLSDAQKAMVEERRLAQLQARLATRTSFYSSPSPSSSSWKGRKDEDRVESESGGSKSRRESLAANDSEEARLFRDSESPPEQQRKQEQPDTEMDYQTFINRLMLPECEVLVGVIRRFLASVLGPTGDGETPPERANMKVDYNFYGTQHLARRCADFFSAMHDHFMAHPSWRCESEERLLSACDCLEKYVMSRIAELAFRTTEAAKEDEQLSRRLQLLKFLKPEALEISADHSNELIWALARDELRKINSYKTPGEKIACVVKCASVIFRSLSLSQMKLGQGQDGVTNASSVGADDFLPIFIWVVLKSHVPKLISNCEYIQAFHSPRRLMGKSGYCFVNLRSALEFILNADADSVSGMDAVEFERCLKEEERFLSGGF